MTYFIIWEPLACRLRFVKTDCCSTVWALRKKLRLPIDGAQIFKLTEQKYNYAKEIISDVF